MIQLQNKSSCCGCSACVQICPKQCINFDEDEQGFRYPVVTESFCVDCGLCEKVCPCINYNDPITPISSFAAKNSNNEIRRLSSSGGIFTKLAESVINEGGVVFGAHFNDKWEVVHSYTTTIEGLQALRGSKYVQSVIGDSYIRVREFLKSGRKVLFTGTPCQVSGLKRFLRNEYENLITVDFICHGVPSPGVFRWYLQEELNNYVTRQSSGKNSVSFSPIHSIPKGDILIPKGFSIKDIRFRDKREGWKKYSFVLTLAEASAEGKQNTVSFSSNVCENTFLKGFCSDLYLRPSCHQCPSKNHRSGSDITLSDFWGQEYMYPEFDNDTGVSAVIINTDKGSVMFNSLKDICVMHISVEDILSYNPSLRTSKPQPYISKKFWKMRNRFSFKERVNRARTLSIVERLFIKAKSYLSK